MADIRKLPYCAGGEWKQTASGRFMDITDASTGEVIAQAPCCTREEVEQAIESAHAAFLLWKKVPVMRRVQVLHDFRQLLVQHMDELTRILCTENGKTWDESQGDLLKVKEPLEMALGAPALMMGESLMNTSKGYDTVLYKEPVGVFAGIAPFNFPGMIPMGWMMPLCVATGNALVLKASSMTPMTCMRLLELLYEAGLPKGLVALVTAKRTEAELLLTHPLIRGVSFVGSTSVGLHVYSTAAGHGKRVQALCEAKNHALVLEDAMLDRTARGIINSSFGCAGERCMALPVVCVQESVADELVALLIKYAKELVVGPAYDKNTQLGPLVTKEHRQFVLDWIARGAEEGADLILDGRGVNVPGYEGGYFVGPTIFDRVEENMRIGNEEVFGPVLCIKRVKGIEDGIRLINGNPFANGAVIYTQSGGAARRFTEEIDGGMVGVNVGIPVPVGYFPFSGHKQSFFGDLHTLGKDGVRFFTETKVVTSTWFDETSVRQKVDTWDGSLNR